jgi:hypothetical protein
MTSLVSKLRLLLALMLCVPCVSAMAQTQNEAADRAAARRLASDGFAALERGAAADAEASFTRAIALYRAPTLYLARGRARVQLSWLVAAGEDFRAAVNLPATEEEPEAYAQARVDAAKEWNALEPRFPTLTVQVAGGTAQQLKVNGVQWPLDATGVARPLDPGDYKVEAIDAQGLIHTSAVRLEEGRASVAEVNLLDAGTAPPPAAVAASQPAPSATPADAHATTSDGSSIPTAVWVSGGITVALVVGAIVTGIIAAGKHSDYDDNNRPDVARSKKEDLRSSASTIAWVNTAFVGAALVGGGVTTYLWLSQPDSDVHAEEHAKSAAPMLARGLMANVRLTY